jgi:hypothetical protein
VVTAVPRLVWFSGTVRPADRAPAAAVESVTVSVYRDETGGEPIWQETQNIVVGAGGRYNVLVGSSTADGLPVALFTSGQPRWLSVQFDRGGEPEQPRVQFASVPYALKAIDADTLGGRPASGPRQRAARTRPSRRRPPGRRAASACSSIPPISATPR